jgi:hypothetical protein
MLLVGATVIANQCCINNFCAMNRYAKLMAHSVLLHTPYISNLSNDHGNDMAGGFNEDKITSHSYLHSSTTTATRIKRFDKNTFCFFMCDTTLASSAYQKGSLHTS